MGDEVVNLGAADKDPLRKGTRDYVIDTVQLPPLGIDSILYSIFSLGSFYFGPFDYWFLFLFFTYF